MTDDELKAIYASAPVTATPFEVISAEAPWFSKTYYLQNVLTEELSVTLETGQVVSVDYAPMALEQASSNADLNYERRILIQMVNDVIADEMSKYDPDLHEWTDFKMKSRGYIYYRTGDVSGIKTPVVVLPVRGITMTYNGVSAKVSSKPVNESATGEVATVNRVPMMKGFV